MAIDTTATPVIQKQPFGKFREMFWPIHNYELKKILPMLLMFFFIAFNYSLLRNLKDALIVPTAGAEMIPFLKFGCIIPAAIIFMIVFAKLSNILSKPALFYTVVTFFLAFFALFGLVLYPAKDFLHPVHWDTTVLAPFFDYLKTFSWGEGFVSSLQANAAYSSMIGIVKYWTFVLFYVLAELWGSAVLGLLFWGFANDITRVGEAKRFYALFGIGANLALIVAGPVIKYIAQTSQTGTTGDTFQTTIYILMAVIVIAAFLVMATYRWINKNVLTDTRFYDPTEIKKKKKSKPKMSLMQSFKFLASSKYLSCIAALVFCYGISIVLIEVTWKSQVKIQYPTSAEYLAFLGDYTLAMGITTIFLILCVSSQVMRRFGWGVAAQTTPITLLITGAGFFILIVFKDYFAGLFELTTQTMLFVAVMFGTAQNVMSKACKYSMFDPTKEMSYIPLDEESKVKGKAAIDVVGARLGKAGGSLIQFLLIAFVGPLAILTPYIGLILFLVIAVWIYSAYALNKRFLALTGGTIDKSPIEGYMHSSMQGMAKLCSAVGGIALVGLDLLFRPSLVKLFQTPIGWTTIALFSLAIVTAFFAHTQAKKADCMVEENKALEAQSLNAASARWCWFSTYTTLAFFIIYISNHFFSFI